MVLLQQLLDLRDRRRLGVHLPLFDFIPTIERDAAFVRVKKAIRGPDSRTDLDFLFSAKQSLTTGIDTKAVA